MPQTKNTFDKDTTSNIIKSFLYGLATAVTAGITVYCNTESVKAALLAALAGFTGSVINVPIEFGKGIKRRDESGK